LRPKGPRQTRGILDAAELGVDNPVAAIGDKNVAILGLSDRHLPGYATFRKRLGQCARIAMFEKKSRQMTNNIS
jgi:hypothetical protein